MASQSIVEGYGRLDALNRIGNQVFSLDLKKPENYAGSSAPVHYPRIWNTPWFDWVQYNGSIMQPMVRNAGKSLGVSAELNLTDPSKGLYKSSVDVDTLHEMEQMIAGKPPNAKDGFSGLTVAEMAGGHPAQDRPEAGRARAANSTRSIVRNVTGHRSRFISARTRQASNPPSSISRTRRSGGPTRSASRSCIMENIPIDHVGTDPAQAADMMNRTVALPANLGINENRIRRRAQGSWSRRPSTTSTTGRTRP